jgi:hypothetical protein
MIFVYNLKLSKLIILNFLKFYVLLIELISTSCFPNVKTETGFVNFGYF